MSEVWSGKRGAGWAHSSKEGQCISPSVKKTDFHLTKKIIGDSINQDYVLLHAIKCMQIFATW